MSSVIDGSFESGWCQQPDLTGELSMTTAKPLARYGAIEGALASGFATAELHHLWERDPVSSADFCQAFLRAAVHAPRAGFVMRGSGPNLLDDIMRLPFKRWYSATRWFPSAGLIEHLPIRLSYISDAPSWGCELWRKLG
ncbi:MULTISPECIES: hypothetical protein [unclassified Mesorhizobium]|uniref:hypothetical protein n=1 Tax=unclassified Mesorhizobium TaxID=325217 RepID=UPI0012DE6CE5|nr:hypothetical protein [Mesorhizobium sp. L2C066B000]